MKNEYGIPVAALAGRDVKELEAYLAELTVKVVAAEEAYESDYNSETRLAYHETSAQIMAFKHTLALLGWKAEGNRIVKRNYGRLNG